MAWTVESQEVCRHGYRHITHNYKNLVSHNVPASHDIVHHIDRIVYHIDRVVSHIDRKVTHIDVCI